MLNRLAVVRGKELVDLPVLRAVGHEKVARIHEEQFSEPAAKRLRLAVEVLVLGFLNTFEHELEQVSLVLFWHIGLLCRRGEWLSIKEFLST